MDIKLKDGTGKNIPVQLSEIERYEDNSIKRADALFIAREVPSIGYKTYPVYTTFKLRQPIRNAVVETKLVVYHNLKKIDFETSLLNWEGVLYREYRFALPLNIKNGQVSYEVPFGVLEVGKDEIAGAAGGGHTTNCADVHPRSIENWIGASDDKFGVTLSSSTAVADYIDPTGLAGDALLLQPIMLASRRSCHRKGNEYLQTGNHYFHFSLTSHKPGYQNGYKFGRQSNEKLLVVVDPQAGEKSSLPEKYSFFTIDAPNISISTIKKAEDDNDVVIRLFEIGIGETKINLNSSFKIANTKKQICSSMKVKQLTPNLIVYLLL